VWVRRLFKVLGLLAVLALLAAWALTLRPTSLGGRAVYITVTGTSMQPTLRSGDLVVLRKQTSYHTGEIVAYRVPGGQPGAGSRVIHRIVGGSGATGYVTRGDNRTSDDFWQPVDGDVLGAFWFRAPGVGRYIPVLRTPVILATLAAAVVVWVVLDTGKKRTPQPD
jgi:signal peptidase I